MVLERFTGSNVPKVCQVDFEGGFKPVQTETRWLPTNVNEGGILIVRKGDSLLLTAYPVVDDGMAIPGGGVEILGAPVAISTTSSVPVAVEFPTAGTWNLSATFTGPDGSTATGQMTVRVEDGSFGPDFPLYLGRPRDWSLPGIAATNPIEWDSGITNSETAATGTGRKFKVNTSGLGASYVVARTSAGGAVIARGAVLGYDVASTSGTHGVRFIDALPDAVGREVPHALQVVRHVEGVRRVESSRVVGVRPQEATGLGRQHELVARLGLQERAEAPLGEAETVVRRGVEVADAAVPRRVEHGPRLVIAQLAEQVADVRGPVAQRGDVECA